MDSSERSASWVLVEVLVILMFLMRSPMHGYLIASILNDIIGPFAKVSYGRLYPLLTRLKALRLVESEWVESESGHPRKYYALTAAGRDRAREMSTIWEKFSLSLGRLLTPVKEVHR